MTTLFSHDLKSQKPLAEEMRPQVIADVVGQDHLLKENGPLHRMLASQNLSSVIFWGPPGCGKTTLAKLIAKSVDMEFASLSAVLSGVSDVRKVFEQAEKSAEMGRRTLLFVDEIHRFNRAQQDSFLAHLEDGRIVLIGATTENPSFALNSALLSRAQVLTLKRLGDDDLFYLIKKAEKHLETKLPLDESALKMLPALADGDARYLLSMIDMLASDSFDAPLNADGLAEFLQKRRPLYDKSQEGHYNLISALHKSLRGSDPNAGLYWLSRMLDGGEDPRYILRRLIRFSVEDIGLADPNALVQANAAQQAYVLLGSPEGDLALSQLVVYLATAPKSNALYVAHKSAIQCAKSTGSYMPPKHILNAPTKLMLQEGYGDGYIYDHDTPEGFSGQDYFPKDLGRQEFYKPVERGFERDIKKRLEYWQSLRQKIA